MCKKFFAFSFLLAVMFVQYSAIYARDKNPVFWMSENLDTSTYYYLKQNDTAYYFKFEKITDEKASGKYFKRDGRIVVVPEKFSISQKGKNYIIKFDDRTEKIRLETSVKENGITLRYATVNKVLGIFNKLNWTESLFLKKYKKPPFVKYPLRYKTKLSDKLIIKNDVVYGSSKGYWDSYPSETDSYFDVLTKGVLETVSIKDLSLKMDIYSPENDSIELRPLIVFVHGGGFYIGDKKSEPMVELCKNFAEMGYVTASVNYRLGFKPVGPSIERAGYCALQDVHAAMRFLVSNAKKYKIDPDLIFIAGSSAGGVISLNLSYMKNENRSKNTFGSFIYDDLGNIESSTNTLKQKFQIKAIANMWGAVTDLSVLDNARIPVISFHGDADKVVPVDYDFPFQDIKGGFSSIVLNKMYGSLPIHIKLKDRGVREELHIFEGAGHSLNVDVDNNLNKNFYFISSMIRDFFYLEIFPEKYKIQSVPSTPLPRAMPIYKTGCKDYLKIFWEIEGGIIIGTRENEVMVIWFGDAKTHKLKLSVLSDKEAGFYDEYEF